MSINDIDWSKGHSDCPTFSLMIALFDIDKVLWEIRHFFSESGQRI